MNSVRLIACLVLLCTPLLAQADWDPGVNSPEGSWGVVPGEIIVKLRVNIEPAALKGMIDPAATGLAVLDQVSSEVRAIDFKSVFPHEGRPLPSSPLQDLTRFYRLRFEAVRDPALVAEAISRDPGVELAEVITWHAVDDVLATDLRSVAAPNPSASPFLPNDPRFGEQWYLAETLPEDNDIDAPEAWEIQTGDPDVIIVFFDTGVEWDHPELRRHIWVNPGEDLDHDGVVYDHDDLNGVDDDANGMIDDLIGWDFVQSTVNCEAGEDCSGEDNDPMDFYGHGTYGAGIAVAVTNNSRDGAGVAGGRYPLQRGCVVMPCRVGWAGTGGGGFVRTDYVGEAVNYAVANGARIGNLSAGASSSTLLAAALVNAFADGFIFVKSAGNDNQTVPDAFDNFQSTVSVTSTDDDDRKASFSNFGIWIDISAPGVAIWNLSFGAGWGTGTSAAMVTAGAALICANNPGFTKAEIESTLLNSADAIDHLNPGYEFMLGSGRLNVGNALMSVPQAAFGAVVLPPPDAATAAAIAASLTPDWALIGEIPITVQFEDQSPGTPTAWLWDFGDEQTSSDQNPLHTYSDPGVYDVRLDATHAEGVGRKRLQNAVVAHADTLSITDGETCPGGGVTVAVNLTNAIPVHQIILPLIYQGPADMTLDSFWFEQTRVEYFEELERPFSSASNKFSVFQLVADKGGGSAPLPPGSGPILYLRFAMDESVSVGTENPVDTNSLLNFSLELETIPDLAYIPAWQGGTISVVTNCRGDFDLNGLINSSDIIQLVNYVFKSGLPSSDPFTMDVNGDGIVTATDVIFLVNYVFKGGPEP